MKTYPKIYPKVNADICDFDNWKILERGLDADGMSVDELISRFRTFYKKAYSDIFDFIVREIWLEQKIIIDGKRKVKRFGQGVRQDIIFGKFSKMAVGMSHRVLTASFCFTPIATYLIDFFPEFLFDDPDKNPEKYKYPYKNIGLDQMMFVYQMHNRLELLNWAEERGMKYAEFINYAYNWALCYNNEIGEEVYTLLGGKAEWPFIRNNKLKNGWENSKFIFDVKR